MLYQVTRYDGDALRETGDAPVDCATPEEAAAAARAVATRAGVRVALVALGPVRDVIAADPEPEPEPAADSSPEFAAEAAPRQ